jgi:hypothetical protein
MYEEHPVFTPPPNPNTKIWRYMDIAKFIDLLSKQKLFFPVSSKLLDPYEGIVPPANRAAKVESLKRYKDRFATEGAYEEFVTENVKSLRNTFESQRDRVFISSWHVNEYESASMWSTYAGNDEGIAVQSTFARLCRSFEKNDEDTVYIGLVKYSDYDKELMDEGNGFEPFVRKRKSFESESELRALTIVYGLVYGKERLMKMYAEYQNPPGEPPLSKLTFESITDGGKYIAADLPTLIENVYVAPLSKSWYLDAVRSIAAKYLPGLNVTRSDLYSLK